MFKILVKFCIKKYYFSTLVEHIKGGIINNAIINCQEQKFYLPPSVDADNFLAAWRRPALLKCAAPNTTCLNLFHNRTLVVA